MTNIIPCSISSSEDYNNYQPTRQRERNGNLHQIAEVRDFPNENTGSDSENDNSDSDESYDDSEDDNSGSDEYDDSDE